MLRGTHQVGAAVTLFGLAALLAEPVWVVPLPATDRELAIVGAPASVNAGLQALGLSPARPALPPALALLCLAVAVAAGTAPDLDKPRRLWARLVFLPLSHGHRHLWHSLLGLCLWAALFAVVLPLLFSSAAVLPEPVGTAAMALGEASGAIWLAAVAGYASHLMLDGCTVEGVPWLYPLPWRLGLPPVPRWRIRTGGMREQWIVLPALLVLSGLLWSAAGRTLLRWIG